MSWSGVYRRASSGRSTKTRRWRFACSQTSLCALSPAVNDPTTAVQALDEIDGLLRQLLSRDLTVGAVEGTDRRPRLLLRLPTWEDYVAVALDEIIAIGDSWQVRPRVDRLLTELIAIAPADRAEALHRRIRRPPARASP